MVSAEARYRLLFNAENDPELQQDCITASKADIVFWFNHFCYTYNPRVFPADLPFNLYSFQPQVVRLIQKCILEGEPLLIEKSRDMGITWLVVLVFQWYWQFTPGCDFLIGSKTRDLVDKKGNKSTIFQKLRYNIQMQPPWMLPRLDKNHDTYMKIIHPVNGNAIIGETSGPDFGRSGRCRAAFMDEMPRYAYGRAAYESVTQSTDCIIVCGTPYGKANEFYKMRSDESLEWVDIESNQPALDPT
jgi:phage terminase large subunit